MNKDDYLLKIAEHANKDIPAHRQKFSRMIMEAFLMGKEYGREEMKEEMMPKQNHGVPSMTDLMETMPQMPGMSAPPPAYGPPEAVSSNEED